jgi:hypothetical protein
VAGKSEKQDGSNENTGTKQAMGGHRGQIRTDRGKERKLSKLESWQIVELPVSAGEEGSEETGASERERAGKKDGELEYRNGLARNSGDHDRKSGLELELRFATIS